LISGFSDVLRGVQLLLGTQLIVVGLLHFFAKTNKARIWLAVLCLIHGSWFLKHVFYDDWSQHLVWFLLIGPGKPIFVGAILFFYYQSLTKPVTRQTKYIHLSIPASYYITLVVVRFFYGSHLSTNQDFWVSLSFSFWALLIFWFYFFLTKKEFRTALKKSLIPRAYQRARVLFFSLYFFLLQIPFWDMFDTLSKQGVLSAKLQWLQTAYDYFFVYAGHHASYVYIHFLGYFVFIYTLIELPYLKKYLLPKEIRVRNDFLKNKQLIESKVQQVFFEDKIFLNPDLTIEKCMSLLQVSRAALVQYLELEYQSTFKDFINKLRVDEVKRLIQDTAFTKYDLMGIASQAGFQSKSTFHRVFKKMEGLTPTEYKSKRDSRELTT